MTGKWRDLAAEAQELLMGQARLTQCHHVNPGVVFLDGRGQPTVVCANCASRRVREDESPPIECDVCGRAAVGLGAEKIWDVPLPIPSLGPDFVGAAHLLQGQPLCPECAAWLPDAQEKIEGHLLYVQRRLGELLSKPVSACPHIYEAGDGGPLDILVCGYDTGLGLRCREDMRRHRCSAGEEPACDACEVAPGRPHWATLVVGFRQVEMRFLGGKSGTLSGTLTVDPAIHLCEQCEFAMAAPVPVLTLPLPGDPPAAA